MPKGRIKKPSLRLSPPAIALLLVKFFLIKIGNMPLLAFRYLLAAPGRILYICATAVGYLSKLRPPSFHFVGRSHTRGRPKKFRISGKAKILIGISAFCIFFFSYTVILLTAAYEIPTPSRLSYQDNPLTSEFYDRNGNLLYRFYDGRNRTLVKLPEIPKDLINATIAAEDKNFYRHIGIDPTAILRALYHNFKNGSQEGASTITQQLIKNSLLTPERTYARKIREIILALWVERVYSKDQILQMYYNEAPFGGSIVGIAAASQTYFGKPPTELDLAESAFLAGLPASPTQFSPYGSQPDLAKIRQKTILDSMVQQKYITKTQAEKAYSEELNIKPQVNDIEAPHFVYYIKELLAQKYGSRTVAQGGLKVYTTLDLNIQKQVENIVKDEIDKLQPLDVKNGAAMVLDSKTGQILAMVGSRDYHYPGFGNFNAALSLRQPGSSIKPITYVTAFEKGFSPTSIILDTPVSFKDEWGNSYAPVNYDGTFHGPVTIRQALGSSLNIPAVKLLATVGLGPVIQTAKDLGITSFNQPERYGLSLTLGGAEVRMIEMMGAYGALSQNGILHEPTGILKVTDSGNNVIEEYKDSSKQAVSAQSAYLITNILSDDNARKIAFGLNSLLKIPGFEVAVKTGTSDNKRDNWTFGYTPTLTVGVWVGNPDNKPMNPRLTSGITGAAPIWNRIMHTLLDNTKPLAFQRPEGISETALPKAMVRVRKQDDKLIYSDNFSSYATSSAQPAPVPHGTGPAQQADQVIPIQPNL